MTSRSTAVAISAARGLLAALSGWMVFMSYAPHSHWRLGIIGITLLLVAAAPWGCDDRPRLRVGALVGLIHGLTLYLFLLPWIGVFVGKMPYIALAITESLYSIPVGLFAAAATSLAHRRRYWALAAFALMFSATEWLRSTWPFGGFAWGRISWGQVDGPLVGFAALGGPSLVTAATVACSATLFVLVSAPLRLRGQPSARPATSSIIAPTAVSVAGLLAVFGSGAWLTIDQDSSAQAAEKSDDVLKVAAVQGNVPRMGLDFNAQRRAVLNNHVKQTEGIDQPVDLVVWPENASDVNPFSDPTAMASITRAVNHANAPTLVGTLTRDPEDHNTVVVFDPTAGPGERHYKKYLQPFGEYMPYRSFFRLFSSYVDQAGNFVPGDGNGVVHINHNGHQLGVGVSTCYEVAFDAAGRDAVKAGAEILTTPTNNATFGFTDMTYQQLAMSRLRARELDRSVIVAATSGSSAIILPNGQVTQQSGIFEAATLIDSVPLRTTVTFAARYGNVVEYLTMVFGWLSAIAALLAARRADAD
ncbi:apolipoprotein N-acyltransferase [Corynebacterium argentoratense]